MSDFDHINETCSIGFNDRWVMLLTIPLLGIILPFVFFDAGDGPPDLRLLVIILLSSLHALIFWTVDKWIIIYFRKKYPAHRLYRRRLFLQLSVIVVVTFVLLSLMSRIPFFGGYGHPQFGEMAAATYSATAVIVTIYEAMYFFGLWKRELLKNEKLETLHAKTQLDVLKNQVNPHFLFNSFNTLVSIIPENQDTAVKFATALSDFYRYILQFRDRELIPVREELECVASYFLLLKIRFGEAIEIRREGSFPADRHIVPLSLQILVENAIKHNVLSPDRPLRIKIKGDEGRICVTNSLQPKRMVTSTHTGLANIRKRYELLTGQQISVVRRDTTFEVCLPLIEVKKL